MSMVCTLRQINSEAMEYLVANPEQITQFLEQYWLKQKATNIGASEESELYLDKFYSPTSFVLRFQSLSALSASSASAETSSA
jgi:hypothetical protein